MSNGTSFLLAQEIVCITTVASVKSRSLYFLRRIEKRALVGGFIEQEVATVIHSGQAGGLCLGLDWKYLILPTLCSERK